MISFERQKSHSCIPMMAMFVDNLHVGSFMGHTVRVYGHSYEQNRYVIDKSGDKLPLTGGNCPGGDCPGANVLHSINYPHLRAGPSGHFLNWTRVEHAC